MKNTIKSPNEQTATHPIQILVLRIASENILLPTGFKIKIKDCVIEFLNHSCCAGGEGVWGKRFKRI